MSFTVNLRLPILATFADHSNLEKSFSVIKSFVDNLTRLSGSSLAKIAACYSSPSVNPYSLLHWNLVAFCFFFFLSFGVNFVFFLKIFTIERSYFIYYKLQANNLLPPTLPSFWLRKTNFFCLLPLPTLTLPLSEDESDKVSNSYGLQNIFNLLPFSLVHSMIFSSFIEIFSSMFLI